VSIDAVPPPVLVATLMREQGDTGVQTHFVAFARHLQAVGRQVEIVTPYGQDARWFYPLYGLRFVLQAFHGGLGVWWYRYSRLLALRWRLWRRMRHAGPCLVYAQCPVSAAAALTARRGAHQKVALVVHFNVSQADEFAGQGFMAPGSWVWRSIRKFEAATLPRLDGVVFVSRFMREQLLNRIPALGAVEHAEIPNFVTSPAEGGALVREARRRLIAIGTLEPRKNQQHLLRAFAGAARQLAGLELTLAGDGPDRRMLQALAVELGVADRVRFLGHVGSAARLLPQHDAYIHTAKLENLPIAIIEAMSCGLPVFACPVGGIPELIEDGVQGRYLPLDDADAAGAILHLTLRDTVLCERMARAAALKFSQSFETREVAGRLLNFLDGCARGRP
jgi:glycosyltransferase involved in cell wall biosynthesis